MPNIVFSGTLIAPETSAIYQKYVLPIAQFDSLPFVVFRHSNLSHSEVNFIIRDTYRQMNEKKVCYELSVQRNINRIFEFLYSNFSVLPKTEATRIQINNQIRLQKMLSYIYENYAESVTLEDIAKAADISRSEAGRCFRTYMGCSPVEALIQYRLQMAHQLLSERTQTLQQISYACGFNSVNYFSRQFKQQIGVSFSGYLLKSQMQWALERMQKGMRVNEVADALGYGSADSFGKAFVRVFGSAPRHYLNRQRKENKL